MSRDRDKLASLSASPNVHRDMGIIRPGSPLGSSRSNGFDRWFAAGMLHALGDPPIRMMLWDGQAVGRPAGEALSTVSVRDRGALYKLAINPDLQFGELFTQDRLRVDGDLVRLLEMVNRAKANDGSKRLHEKVLGWFYKPRRNTLVRARDNIHQHYDLSNDFYELWLDREMVYTCAYFPTPEASLEDAQIAKMDHVCRKIRLKPGETVVEAGCGWGGLARHMAKHYGVTVKAYNISSEQIRYARERARREGLSDRVEYIEADYREISGQFDAFVSVGMLEHVGPDNYPELGAVMQRAVKPEGRGLVHSIGRDRPALMNAWIEKRIFPGAYPPSLDEMTAIFGPAGFSILDVENLRLHYAKTLEHWLKRYDSAVDQVTKRFGPVFARAWRLYLAGSIAAFSSGDLQLFQVTFARHGNNHIPWTRGYLYDNERHTETSWLETLERDFVYEPESTRQADDLERAS